MEKVYKLKSIEIKGFRRLFSVNIDINPFMVFIGSNGAGKTSLLDIFELLSASVTGKLSETLSKWGGVSRLLTRNKSEFINIILRIEASGQPALEYSLQLEPQGSGYLISQERLFQLDNEKSNSYSYIEASAGKVYYYNAASGILERPDWAYDPMETALSQVPKRIHQAEMLRRLIAATTRYHNLDVGDRAPVKLPQMMKPAISPGSNGEDLLPFLFCLREGDKTRFDKVIDALNAAFPDFAELNFPPAATGMLSMTWKDRNFTQPIYANELSEGMLRFLWLTALLQNTELSAITMIDEPEVSLHPELLDLLSQMMRETSADTQMIVATHSDRFVRFLKPEEVYVMDINEDGETVVTCASNLDLERWLSDYSLDEVWQMGRLGGRA